MKKYLAVSTISVLTLGAIIFSRQVMAQGINSANSPTSQLVTRIAQTFNLNEDEVQSVFDTFHEEKMAEQKAYANNQLDELVKAGKITEAQKQLIEQKRSELIAQREASKDSWQSLSPEERRTQMETQRKEVTDWAKANGIELGYLMPMGMGRGPAMGHHHRFDDQLPPASDSQ